MRIIAGHFRSRVLKTPPGLDVRPTPDRLRESLFSILGPSLHGKVFLDAYAGSGAVGLEALSRGAAHVIFIERHAKALQVLEQNVRSLCVAARVTVLRGRALSLLPRQSADIVFLDPPYEQAQEYALALDLLAAAHCPLVIAQHSVRLTLAERYGVLAQTRQLRQGDNALTFFRFEKPSD